MFDKIDTKKLMELIVIVLIIVQLSSWALSFFTHIPPLKMGSAILLIILASAMTVLIGASFQFGKLTKLDLFMLLILIGAMVGLYVYIPKYFPQLFSILRSGAFSAIGYP